MAADDDLSDRQGQLDSQPAHGDAGQQNTQQGRDPAEQRRGAAGKNEESPLYQQYRDQGQSQRQAGSFCHSAGDYIYPCQ